MGDLNRIYIRHQDLARSLFRRRKELGFTSTDVMRCHWNRQGPRARAWAQEKIVRMRKDGIIETCRPLEGVAPPEGDRRMRWYRFTAAFLREYNLNDVAAAARATDDKKEWVLDASV